MRNNYILISFFCLLVLAGCSSKGSQIKNNENINLKRARVTLDSLYKHYSAPDTELLRENYPFDAEFKATYLASEEAANQPNSYSFLWPYSGTFSAVAAILHAENTTEYKEILDNKVLSGLEEYFDTKRTPTAYASYINTAPESDRFYDDNVWLGIDFCDVFEITKEERYLDKAKLIWKFIESGMDDSLGGGIYWCEQKKESKNTCSNAPGAVYALKLFLATQDSSYFKQGKFLYEWTKKNLQDTSDYLYFDNIKLDGSVDKAKYAYNSGQMMQAAVLLYNCTNNTDYLEDAQNIAKGCHQYFFHEFKDGSGKTFRLLNKGNTWFTAVMFRGFIELYHVDKNSLYIDDFGKSLDYAWEHARDNTGLFESDWSGDSKENKKWLLTEAAMVEMYARMATVK